MVRSGLRTRPAGTAADSMPSMANSAMVDAAIKASSVIGVLGTCCVYTAGSVKSSQPPSPTMKIIGSSFSAVVTTCTPPPMRTPSRLMATKIQISNAACTTGGHGVESRQHLAQVADEADRERSVGDPAGDPIAPDRDVGGQLAGGLLDVGVGAVGRRKLTGELREHARKQGHAQHRDAPAQHCIEAVRRQRCRQHENAHADGVADHQRRAHPESELFRLLHFAQAPLPCSASSRAVRSRPTASSTSAIVVESGGMKRRVLTPHESSSRPL